MAIPKISPQSLKEIRSKLKDYKEECFNNLREQAAKTAYGDADRFIRWLEGTYSPNGKP